VTRSRQHLPEDVVTDLKAKVEEVEPGTPKRSTPSNSARAFHRLGEAGKSTVVDQTV
jgi:hypothetical protein